MCEKGKGHKHIHVSRRRIFPLAVRVHFANDNVIFSLRPFISTYGLHIVQSATHNQTVTAVERDFVAFYGLFLNIILYKHVLQRLPGYSSTNLYTSDKIGLLYVNFYC